MEIVERNEIVAEEESKVLEDSHGISISLGIEDDDQIGDEFEIIDVQRYHTGTKQVSHLRIFLTGMWSFWCFMSNNTTTTKKKKNL